MGATDFDQWAHHYDDSRLQPLYAAAHHAVLHRARQFIDGPHRVLDVGCGTGRLLRMVAKHFPDSILIGLDSSNEMLSVASRRNRAPLHPAYIRAAAERLPFAEDAFDLVMTTASFRHWADHRAAFREIGRVLAPDGLLGFADLFASRRARLTHRSHLPQALAASLAAAGLTALTVEAATGFGPITEITVVLAAHMEHPFFSRAQTWLTARRWRTQIGAARG